MGGGSSELRALIERIDELECAIEKLQRANVLRAHRLAEVEKAVNEHDSAVVGLVDRLGKLEKALGPLDWEELLERLDNGDKRVEALEKILRSAQDDKPKSGRRAKPKGGD